jgi:DNA-binding MarR family transcriptional regulator
MSNNSIQKYASVVDHDPIERLRSGWAAELPDLDTSAMATVARINRLAILLRRSVDQQLEIEGSNLAEFDVLSALRRSGPPYRLKPSELARVSMLSPSGMTHRIDLLEAAGLVVRVADPDSRRTAPVELTAAGLAASEQLARVVVDVERRLLGAVSAGDRRELDRIGDALLSSMRADTP